MSFGMICLIYVISLAIILAEAFLPGGILGIVGALLMVGSIVLSFYHHPPIYGISLVFISLIIVPTILIWALRQITLSSSQTIEEGYTSSEESLEELLGKEGVTMTMLRPYGIAKIDGRRIDVTSEVTMIPKDTPIKVKKVEGNRVIVKTM